MSDAAATGPTEAEIESVMRAARVLVGVSAQSFAVVEDRVTLPQLRVLVMVASRGPLRLAAVADGLGVHPSNASRAVDRLVVAGLLGRTDDPADRRQLVLRLTDAGTQLVDEVMRTRRTTIDRLLSRMAPTARAGLAPALEALSGAAGDGFARAVWSMGWTTADDDTA
ncbi:MarR family winged helix-turn-helix transcriptional regulator [Pseudonocardia sp. N23]|uniref:MarR family winged helix-turn-helix transcriptional regulator n=1 Tax=Pseudonocardia sp. N23 TaxID=1987376 RepID=UPI000C034314|nr:MarR family transcriptional regulator [Pseudonocardia sp. N23]GAY12648.1 transcriptional regulator, MarR family [Pseudonocardia sp. N23]